MNKHTIISGIGIAHILTGAVLMDLTALHNTAIATLAVGFILLVFGNIMAAN